MVLESDHVTVVAFVGIKMRNSATAAMRPVRSPASPGATELAAARVPAMKPPMIIIPAPRSVCTILSGSTFSTPMIGTEATAPTTAYFHVGGSRRMMGSDTVLDSAVDVISFSHVSQTEGQPTKNSERSVQATDSK